jgi:hypothetical protein
MCHLLAESDFIEADTTYMYMYSELFNCTAFGMQWMAMAQMRDSFLAIVGKGITSSEVHY